jgi:hypothetical protein
VPTAYWDQPRKGTTVTLRFVGAETATEEELLARLRTESPDLVEPCIEHVNSRGDGWACCLISWRNLAFRGVVVEEVA